MLALILVCSPYVTDKVNLIEVNYYHNQEGDVLLKQIIFWDWNGEGLVVVDWRILNKKKVTGRYHVKWDDKGTLRHVTAKSYRVTHTYFDPEVANRSILPTDQRRKLCNPKNAVLPVLSRFDQAFRDFQSIGTGR